MRRSLLALVLLTGCPAEDAESPAGTSDPVPYVYEEEDPPVADLSAADLEGSIEAAIDLALSLNATPVFPAYAVAMAAAETGCPSYYESEGNVYWYDQCTTSAGASFAGYSFYQLYDQYDAGDGAVYDGEAVYGVAQVRTADGHTFEAGGSAYALVATAETYTYHASVIAGSFAWDGPEAAGTWLGDGVAPDVTLVAYVTEYGDLVQIDGGLSGMGGQLDTVVFDMLTLYEAGLGSTCPTEPGGVVSVRDSAGNWYDVVFDGPTEYGGASDPDLCDGCGAAYFRGEPLGEVCVDFTTLLDWEVSPW